MSGGVVISKDHRLVLSSAVGITLLVVLMGFFPLIARLRIFTVGYLREHFGDQHRQAYGENLEEGGFPDMGSGRYSEKLSYQQ